MVLSVLKISPVNNIISWKLLLLAGDTGAYILAIVAALLINPTIENKWIFLKYHFFEFILLWLTYLFVFYIADIYDHKQDFRCLNSITREAIASLVGTIVIIAVYFFLLRGIIGRVQVITQAAFFTLMLIAWRWLFSTLTPSQRPKRRMLIIGAGKAGRYLLETIRRQQSGIEVIGFIDDNPDKLGSEIDGVPVLRDSLAIPYIQAATQVDLMVVAITHRKSQQLLQTLAKNRWKGCEIQDMPGFYEFLTNKILIEHVSDTWLFINSLRSNKFYYRRIKRLLDMILAGIALIITSPIFLLCIVWIKIDSRGPIFYRQERLGQAGHPFWIIKFRTTIENAVSQGPQWTEKEGLRITRAGRFLRKLRLNKLPQLLNVLKGDMSIVGPRPQREVIVQKSIHPGLLSRMVHFGGTSAPAEIKEIPKKIPYYNCRLLVKPGITGWAQVMFPYPATLEDSKEELKYDLYYIKNMSFVLDIAILIKTMWIVLFGVNSRNGKNSAR